LIRLILYSRPDCHLCEELAAELAPLIAGRATLEHVDVSRDPGLTRRYGLRIPVVAAGDTELSGYPLDRGRVLGFLESRRLPE
jgi:hypothetical protein